jgi:hypothetical protein
MCPPKFENSLAILSAFLTFPTCVTYHVHFVLPDLITKINLGTIGFEDVQQTKSELCLMQSLLVQNL